MTQQPGAIDAAEILAAAVRERMLTEACARDLAKQLDASDLPPAQRLVEIGRLTPIQVEAIEGLLAPQSVAAGYEVLGLLGYGGIGIVYRARQPSLDRVVALKTISTARVQQASGGNTSSALARFQQEAVAIAKLKHPNIVTAYDYGAGDDRLYLAMEMVDGIDLDTFIREKRRVDEVTAWRLAKQTAAALSHALEFEIIHRDVKPANLLLTDPPAGYPLPPDTPLLKVTDFGLARLNANQSSDEATRLTVTGATMGTPHYMAPEQIDDAQVSSPADIYALGATVYHMLAGEPPHAGMSLIKIFAAKLGGGGIDYDKLPPAVSDASRELLQDMLRNNPSERPQDYEELLARIDEVLGDDSAQATTVLATTFQSTASKPPSGSDESLTLISTPSRKKWNMPLIGMVGGSLAIVAAIGALALSSFGGGRSKPPTPRYKVSTGLNADVQLYNNKVGSWRARPLVENAADRPGFLKFKGSLWKTITDERVTVGSPDHFGIKFIADMNEAESLEVWLERSPQGQITSLRLAERQAVFGHHASVNSEFVPDHPPVACEPRSADSSELNLLVDRDETHWLLWRYASERQPQLIAWTEITAPSPDRIEFRSTGGPVYLGDLYLLRLQPISDGEESNSIR